MRLSHHTLDDNDEEFSERLSSESTRKRLPTEADKLRARTRSEELMEYFANPDRYADRPSAGPGDLLATNIEVAPVANPSDTSIQLL